MDKRNPRMCQEMKDRVLSEKARGIRLVEHIKSPQKSRDSQPK